MITNLDKYKSDLDSLVSLGEEMELDLYLRYSEEQEELDEEAKAAASEIKGSFERNYQRFYTEACAVIRQIIPDRLSEFEQLYKGEGKRKDINIITYTIQDWLNGIRADFIAFSSEREYDDFSLIYRRFSTQLKILRSAETRFESTLFDIRQIVQADLFDSELDAARELNKKGFLRAAGAIAGVVLEKHLRQVCDNHNIRIRKKNPAISDFNDLLKNSSVLDIPTWRQIQRLGDIRNLCDHNKDRDPTKDEVEELINGVDKISKTIF